MEICLCNGYVVLFRGLLGKKNPYMPSIMHFKKTTLSNLGWLTLQLWDHGYGRLTVCCSYTEAFPNPLILDLPSHGL